MNGPAIIRLIFGLKIRSGHKASLNTDLNRITLSLRNLVLIYGINSDLIFNILQLVCNFFIQSTSRKKP